MSVDAVQALLWTDGRYHNQAQKELDTNWTLMKVRKHFPTHPPSSWFIMDELVCRLVYPRPRPRLTGWRLTWSRAATWAFTPCSAPGQHRYRTVSAVGTYPWEGSLGRQTLTSKCRLRKCVKCTVCVKTVFL